MLLHKPSENVTQRRAGVQSLSKAPLKLILRRNFFSQSQTLQFFSRHTFKSGSYFYIFANIEQACSSLFNPVWVVNSIPIVDLNVNLHIWMFDRQILNYVLLEKIKLWDTLSVTCWKQFTVEQKKLWWTLIFISRKFFPREV